MLELSQRLIVDQTIELMNQIGDLFRDRTKVFTPISVEELVKGIDALLDEFEADTDNHYPILDLIDFERTQASEPLRLIYLYMVWRAFATHGPGSTLIMTLARVIGRSPFEAYACCCLLERAGRIEKTNTQGQDFLFQLVDDEEFQRCWTAYKPMSEHEVESALERMLFLSWKKGYTAKVRRLS